MSMFDTIICQYKLPLPEEAGQLVSPPDWSNVQFQTKSFDCTLDTYSIEEDGQIYKDVVVRELVKSKAGVLDIDERQEGIEKVEATLELRFYTIHMEDDFDYWVEFKALFWKGDLKEIELVEWNRRDNEERVKVLENVNAHIDKQFKEKKKWWYGSREKYFILVRLVMFLVRWPIGLIANLTWRIEKWLTRR